MQPANSAQKRNCQLQYTTYNAVWVSLFLLTRVALASEPSEAHTLSNLLVPSPCVTLQVIVFLGRLLYGALWGRYC